MTMNPPLPSPDQYAELLQVIERQAGLLEGLSKHGGQGGIYDPSTQEAFEPLVGAVGLLVYWHRNYDGTASASLISRLSRPALENLTAALVVVLSLRMERGDS